MLNYSLRYCGYDNGNDNQYGDDGDDDDDDDDEGDDDNKRIMTIPC